MSHLNVEIKARSQAHEAIRQLLNEAAADFRGEDGQRDTYFNVPAGRLKLREGNIENALIYYRRSDQAGPKNSVVDLYPVADGAALRALLTHALGVLAVVEKRREIYFIENVKFHLDTVAGLGTFVEIEAIDRNGGMGEARLRAQCEWYIQRFGILADDLVAISYSDMLLDKNSSTL